MKCHTYKYLLFPLLGLVLAFTFCLINPVAAEEEPQLNILTMRVAYIKDGKGREAVQFAKEIQAFIKNKFPHRNVRVYIEIHGEMGKIYWIGEHKDLATLEREGAQVWADPGYHAILSKAVGLFIEGRGFDTLLRLIP